MSNAKSIIRSTPFLLLLLVSPWQQNAGTASAMVVLPCNHHTHKISKPVKPGVAPGDPVIVQKWEVPAILKEISGISWLSEGRFACVQDEEGKIFIYNAHEKTIEKEITFSDPGDYEGIAVVDSTAYVLHSSGKLYEVGQYNTDHPSITTYRAFKKAKQNVESLCFDKLNNRLLLAVKNHDPRGGDFNYIYAFDLATKKFAGEPVYTIDLHGTKGAGKKRLQPSDLAVHPVSGDIYIIDAEHPRLLVLDAKGNIKKSYSLHDAAFSLPEGICFSSSGELFISNEGKSAPGNIIQVSLR